MAVKLEKKYKDDFKAKIVSAVIGVLLGVLLFFLPIENLIPIMAIIFGIIFLISGALTLLFDSSNNTNLKWYKYVIAILQIILGILLLIFRGGVADIVIGAIILVVSIAKIVIANDKKEAINSEILPILLGIFILLFGIGDIVKIVRYIAGALVIIYALYNLYLAYLEYKKAKEADNVLDAEYKEL